MSKIEITNVTLQFYTLKDVLTSGKQGHARTGHLQVHYFHTHTHTHIDELI